MSNNISCRNSITRKLSFTGNGGAYGYFLQLHVWLINEWHQRTDKWTYQQISSTQNIMYIHCLGETKISFILP